MSDPILADLADRLERVAASLPPAPDLTPDEARDYEEHLERKAAHLRARREWLEDPSSAATDRRP